MKQAKKNLVWGIKGISGKLFVLLKIRIKLSVKKI